MRQIKGIVERVVSSPRLFIILPASIAFILSYPFIYTLLTVSLPIKNLETPIQTSPRLLSEDQSLHISSDNVTPILSVKQLYISPPSFSNVLSQQVLDSIAPLISDLALPTVNSGSYSQQSSPHQKDSTTENNDDKLEDRNEHRKGHADEHGEEDSDLLHPDFALIPKIKTLPYLHYYSSSTHNDHFSLLSLKFSSPSLNSVLYLPRPPHYNELKASGILISYFYNNSADEQKWNSAIESFLGPQESLTTKLDGYPSFILPTSKPIKKSGFASYVRSLPFAYFPYCPFPLINLILSTIFLAFYINISWDVSSVRSKSGLFVAFFAQSILTLSSSVSIISYFIPSFSHDSLRHFLLVPFFVIILNVENISRLLNAVAHTPSEQQPSQRIISGMSDSFDKSLKAVVFGEIILLISCLPGLSYSPQIRHICLFAMLAIFIDLILHVTYFTSVLSIDLRRFELEDLLTESLTSNHQPSKYYLKFINADEHFPEKIRPYYLYLRHLYFHPKLSLSNSILFLSIFFLALWGVLTDPANEKFYSSGRIPFFFTHLTASSPIFSQYPFVKIFEPVVLQGTRHPLFSSTSKIDYFLGPSISGSYSKFIRIISINIILELVASIAFILSLTGVILKYVLPPQSERSESTEPNEVTQFFSKDLIGFHTLDVLRIATEGSAIGTVSLDHKVCVWNPASATGNRLVKPIPIPLATEFWPVTRMVINSQLSMVAIFSSRVSGIWCWDYKSNVHLYHIQDDALFSTAPVETFFSGPDLIVVTNTCSVVSISEVGQITQFPIEFPSKTSQVIHARRLLTPRIPERIISMSSENEISIGTHIGRAWRFRRLMIQESPMQFTLHTLQSQGGVHVHDLSKYKPQPIPAPQAMMARNPMRAGRISAVNRIPNIPPIRRSKILDEKVVSLVPVPAINMVLIATAVHVCLFDAQTGIIVKHFEIGHLKPSSLRAFHSQPTHCRFCGCVSVDTFSIAYSDAEHEGLTICHTLTIDNRAKNSICIRVERDPRETRCLGFEATTERQHWIDRVEGWDATDMNMIMGVRRKEPPFQEDDGVLKEEVTNPIISLFTRNSEGLRRRRAARVDGSSIGASGTSGNTNGGDMFSGHARSASSSSNNTNSYNDSKGAGYGHYGNKQSSGGALTKHLEPSLWDLILDILIPVPVLDSQTERWNRTRGLGSGPVYSKPTLGMTWEGWAMSATGQVTYYDIPDLDSGGRKIIGGDDGNGKKNGNGVGGGLLLNGGGNSGNGHGDKGKKNMKGMMLNSGLFNTGKGGAVSNTIGTELDSVSFDRLLISSIGPVTKYGAKSIAVTFGNVIKVLYFGNEESLLPSVPQPMTAAGALQSKQQRTRMAAVAAAAAAGNAPAAGSSSGAGGNGPSSPMMSRFSKTSGGPGGMASPTFGPVSPMMSGSRKWRREVGY
ncbi:uncharacterized protein SAPINGB_P003364 [Magnusiomyces paraingens]|uniref:SSD domain-containing protein n=1 Tax=Magnusiomyces paraingens TaxID=2606893 RepID=A0A5E8BQ07_9ASCO|nr:uncharacterized protein SAPINGB_P003364 [Saprochaete ingens]VVT53021.1 unnamed protein product [Saprochaete ingens]